MVTCRATLGLPDDLVSRLENLIAARRSELGVPWRRLTSSDQAVLVLVLVHRPGLPGRRRNGPHIGQTPVRKYACPGACATSKCNSASVAPFSRAARIRPASAGAIVWVTPRARVVGGADR